jgi:6-phosphofructokinase 1
LGGSASFVPGDAGDGFPRHGGAGLRLAAELGPRVEHEIRVTVLGHLQRGGSPVPYDRILATRFGRRAAELSIAGSYGRMVRLRDGRVDDVPIEEAVERQKLVDPHGELVATARAVGIGLGDEPPA